MPPLFETPPEPKRLLASGATTSIGETYAAKYKIIENESMERYELKVTIYKLTLAPDPGTAKFGDGL
jgi:hypothetical protein